jgi:hypothetical protein
MIICETYPEQGVWNAAYGSYIGGRSSHTGVTEALANISIMAADAEDIADAAVLEFRKRLFHHLANPVKDEGPNVG